MKSWKAELTKGKGGCRIYTSTGTHNPTLHQDRSPDTWPPENLEWLLGMQANCHTRDFHT